MQRAQLPGVRYDGDGGTTSDRPAYERGAT